MGILKWLEKRQEKLEPPICDGPCPERMMQEAEQRKREAYGRRPLVELIASRIDSQGERNHFGEILDETFGQRRPKRA